MNAMTMNKLPALLTMLCLSITASCYASADAQPVAVEQRVVLVVDEIHAIRNFPVVLADRLGYLKDGNMAVTVMNVRYDAWHGDMLMDGRVDAVMAYYHHNIVNHSIGRDTQAIITLGVTPGMKVLVSNQAKDKIRTLADLKGSHIISGGAGSSKSTIANYLVRAGGNPISSYTRLGTDGKDRNTESLRQGNADLLIAPVPEGEFYVDQGLASVFVDLTTVEGTKKTLGSLFPSSTIFMSSERIKAHPEMAQHLANAFVRTLKFINTHSAEEIAALIPVEVSGKDRVAYLKTLRQQMGMFATDGMMPVDGAKNEWQVLADFNSQYGNVLPEKTYTNRFVIEANRH